MNTSSVALGSVPLITILYQSTSQVQVSPSCIASADRPDTAISSRNSPLRHTSIPYPGYCIHAPVWQGRDRPLIWHSDLASRSLNYSGAGITFFFSVLHKIDKEHPFKPSLLHSTPKWEGMLKTEGVIRNS